MELPDRLLTGVFDLIREGIIVVDHDGCVGFVNRRAKEFPPRASILERWREYSK